MIGLLVVSLFQVGDVSVSCDVVTEPMLAGLGDVVADVVGDGCSEAELAALLSSCAVDDAALASLSACAGTFGLHDPDVQDGIFGTHLYGFQEEIGLRKGGHYDGLVVKFGKRGEISNIECWRNGLLQEERQFSRGRLQQIITYEDGRLRTREMTQYFVGGSGYTRVIEHYNGPKGREFISWHEKWSRYTGDRIQKMGPFDWQ